MRQVFEVADRKWRGIGEIADSGFRLRGEYAAYDAERVFNLEPLYVEEPRECISALVFALAFGLRWVPNSQWSGTSAALILWAILSTAAAEEIAFRGYGFWRLIRLVGFWPAQVIVAGLFVVSHLTLGGYRLLPALVGNVTGSLLYGAAFAFGPTRSSPIFSR